VSHGAGATAARTRVAALAVALACAVGALTGCTGEGQRASPPPAPATTTPAPRGDDAPAEAVTLTPDEAAGIGVELRQSRTDWGDRVVQLRVVNGTGAPFVVEHGTLRSPFVGGAATTDPERSREVPPGSHRDFSVALGDPVCPAAVGDVVVDLVVVDDAERRGALTTVPTDPQGHLERIHREDCAAAAVTAGVTLAFEPDVGVRDEGGVLVGTLRLTARPVPGGPRVSVTAVERSNLLTPTSGLAWSDPALLDLPPAGATVDLDFTQARCDPHAVAEDKRGTFFAVHASVDGAPQPAFYLGVDDAVRAQVYAYIGRACGWA